MINKIVILDYSRANTVINLVTLQSKQWHVSKSRMHISDLIAGVYPQYTSFYTLTDTELRHVVTRLMGIHALVLRFFDNNKELNYDAFSVESMLKNTIQ